MNPADSHSQRGAAYIYIMLIFVAASTIAVGILSREQIDIVRTDRFLMHQQLVQYAYGAETYARQLIYNKKPYAKPAAPSLFTLQDGKVEMAIGSMQGVFNINNLRSGAPAMQERFQRLCENLGIDKEQADMITASLKQPSSPAKTGDIASQAIAPELMDISELLDRKTPPSVYKKLAPYIAALPDIVQNIDVNVASAPVLAAYIPQAEQRAALQAAMKKYNPMTADALSSLGLGAPGIEATSTIFRARITVSMHEQQLSLTSILYQKPLTGETIVLARSWGD